MPTNSQSLTPSRPAPQSSRARQLDAYGAPVTHRGWTNPIELLMKWIAEDPVKNAKTVAEIVVGPYGVYKDAGRTRKSFSKRNYGEAAFNATMMGLGALPFGGAMVKGVKGARKMGSAAESLLGAYPSTTAGRILNETKKGGYSVHVGTGREPPDGLMAGIYPNTDPRNVVLPGGGLNKKAIEDFAAKNQKALAQDDRYLGTWQDPSDSQVYLDVSRRFEPGEVRPATKFAEKTAQLEIYDAGNGVTLPVGNWKEFIDSPEFTSRLGDMEKIGRKYLKDHAGPEWWDMYGTKFEEIYGAENMRKLAGVLAATSPNSNPRTNIATMSEYMRRIIKSEDMIQPGWRTPADAMTRNEGMQIGMESSRAKNLLAAEAGDIAALRKQKVNNMARALIGDPDAIVLDRHFAKVGEKPKAGVFTNAEVNVIKDKEYDYMFDNITQYTKDANASLPKSKHRDARDRSADIWTGIRETIQKTGELFGTKYPGASIPGESKAISSVFEDMIKEKAAHLKITVQEMEKRLKSGDAELLSYVLAAPVGAKLFSDWRAAEERREPAS